MIMRFRLETWVEETHGIQLGRESVTTRRYTTGTGSYNARVICRIRTTAHIDSSTFTQIPPP